MAAMNASLQPARIPLDPPSHGRGKAPPPPSAVRGALRSSGGMSLRQPCFPQRAAQRGAVLFVALVFLILITLLAIGASSGSLLQQRMVAATRSAQLAVMSANTALRGAEWQLWSATSVAGEGTFCGLGTINPDNGCVRFDPTSALYAPGGAVAQFRTDNNRWLSLTGPVTYKQTNSSGAYDFTDVPLANSTSANASVAQNPQYIIEDLGLVKPPGAGPQSESGVTGPNNVGGGSGVNIHIYRITARATGGNANTVRVVQSTFDAQASN